MLLYLQTALAGGLLAGLLDIIYALSAYAVAGVPPQRLLQVVASGILGESAFKGGWQSALFGLSLHFSIALIMAAVFVAAFLSVDILRKHLVLAGCSYGLLLYGAMNYVIVPLSKAVPGKPPEGWLFVSGIAAHIFLVGLPIAWATDFFLQERL